MADEGDYSTSFFRYFLKCVFPVRKELAVNQLYN